MIKIRKNIQMLAQWVSKKTGIHRESLNMDVLMQFGFLALCLWVIVENSPEADAAFTMVLNAGRDAVVGVFRDVGNL
ncbi:hypothetical protein ACFSR7_05750 [Cohnella sp. GCM10020058]|uniref:hypothetical protein n=1 Tax=Cohnella sp. GCM10020058 TaxID=3317330 RepID=UPI003632E4A0